jgi:hypothetical protein
MLEHRRRRGIYVVAFDIAAHFLDNRLDAVEVSTHFAVPTFLKWNCQHRAGAHEVHALLPSSLDFRVTDRLVYSSVRNHANLHVGSVSTGESLMAEVSHTFRGCCVVVCS